MPVSSTLFQTFSENMNFMYQFELFGRNTGTVYPSNQKIGALHSWQRKPRPVKYQELP
jgi:hypothetical protein